MKVEERKVNLFEIIKAFWQPDEQEVSIEDILEKTPDLTNEERQLLQEKSPDIKKLEEEIQSHPVEKKAKKSNEEAKKAITNPSKNPEYEKTKEDGRGAR